MKAIILAAGAGKRMLPLTLERPKPLIPLLGKPLIEYTLEAIPDAVDDVVIVVGYKGDMIRAHLGESFLGKHITYVEQKELGGPAVALREAIDHLRSEQFLTLYADDVYKKADIEKLLAYRYAMLLSTVADPRVFGVVELDQESKVVHVEEKPAFPKSNTVSTGVFVLDDTIFTYEAPAHPVTGEQYVSDMVMGLAREHPLFGVMSERWIQIGVPDDLVKAEAMLKQS